MRPITLGSALLVPGSCAVSVVARSGHGVEAGASHHLVWSSATPRGLWGCGVANVPAVDPDKHQVCTGTQRHTKMEDEAYARAPIVLCGVAA